MASPKVGDSFPEGVVFSYVPYTEEKGEITACGIPINYDASKGLFVTSSDFPSIPLYIGPDGTIQAFSPQYLSLARISIESMPYQLFLTPPIPLPRLQLLTTSSLPQNSPTRRLSSSPSPAPSPRAAQRSISPATSIIWLH
jgi:hypothetical protein